MTTDRLLLARPLDTPEVPVTELVTVTRRQEARCAMAVAAELRAQGVPVRDMVVVVLDFENYEEPLTRAAVQYEMVPVFWRQLHVTRTRPYGLLRSTCEALGADTLDRDALLRPLHHRWSPPDETNGDWPIKPEIVYRTRQQLPSDARSVETWCELLSESDAIDSRFETFASWLAAASDPSPETITEVVSTVVEGYAKHGLPATKQTDSPALLDTETEARAVVRLRTLVRQLRYKFADRIKDGTVSQTWEDVAELADVIATQRPGRREHSHAQALDIMEANDVWALDVPIVIVVGLTDEEWPRETDSTLPPEFQEAVLSGEGDAGSLAPRPAWIDGRDRDQFIGTLGAASHGVVAVRHTRTIDGDEVHPSPYLDRIDPHRVSEDEVDALLSLERELPSKVERFVPEVDIHD